MSPPRSPHSTPAPKPDSDRHAPLNSVSTRIILCVFVSTLLTALIVSWLSVGAIHSDVRRRVGARVDHLLSERVAEIEAWQSAASAQLAVRSAIGTSWYRQLFDALGEQASRSGAGPSTLYWEASLDRDGSTLPQTLPPPPAPIVAYFDRIALGPKGDSSAAGTEQDCLAVRAELVRPSSEVAGTLEGCLASARIQELLHPPAGPQRGLRLLLADPSGRIAAATGIRSETRIGSPLPLPRLLYAGDGGLPDYQDPSGTRLVGRVAPLGRTGWYLAVETDYARAFAPASEITNQIVIVDVCIILLFSVLAYKITLAIMQPIEALSEGAKRISAGQVDYQIPSPANNDDELGLLTRTFNDMMGKLRSNQLEIEQDRIRLAEKNEELQRANEILAQLSITDGLTKLHNHRYFQDHLTREIKRVSRTRAPLSLILLDIDDFKQLNDTHGHAAGDEVLVSLAAIMNDSARESDLIARYGGEEFVILMPNTDLAGAVHLAEKIRMTVESTRLIIGDNMKPIDITISLGVALFDGDRRQFFAEADRALYQAKAAGKNCVIIAGSEPHAPGSAADSPA